MNAGDTQVQVICHSPEGAVCSPQQRDSLSLHSHCCSVNLLHQVKQSSNVNAGDTQVRVYLLLFRRRAKEAAIEPLAGS